MFFRNLTLYRLPSGWQMPAGTLEGILAKLPLQPCSGMSTTSRGWVSPRGDQQLVASIGKHLLIALGVEQKILPSTVINQTATDRAEKIEKQQGFKVGKKQMRELKEQIMAELLPRAFSKRRSTRAWLSPSDGWLVVDTASVGRAEEVTEQLRNVLGEFPISLPETKLSPVTVMSAWLGGNDAPGLFIIDQDCELRGVDESKPTVRYLRHDLGGKDVAKHINDGKIATKLGLIWNERISFVLDGHLQLKKVRFLDIDKNRKGDQSQNPEEQFDADFALMTGELSRLLADITNQLGASAPIQQTKPSNINDVPVHMAEPPIEPISMDEELAYKQAVELVSTTQKASVSWVQRRFGIGYNRAARLVERMEAEGLVGPSGPGGTREIFIPATA